MMTDEQIEAAEWAEADARAELSEDDDHEAGIPDDVRALVPASAPFWRQAAYDAARERGDICTDDHLCRCPRCAPGEPEANPEDEPYTPEWEAAQKRQAIGRWVNELDLIIGRATREHEYWDLGGIFEGIDPLEALTKALQCALKDVRSLRRHQHEWGEDDYCVICGRDGRA
jgi:hypothetical protein